MFHHQKFPKTALCKIALLNSTSFSPLNYWQKLLDVAELLSASKQSKKRPRKYKLKAEVSITPLLAALLAACSNENVPVGDNVSNIDTTPDTVTPTALSFDLYVLDGAIEGALVYVDENDNGAIDDNETPIGTTDENGRVSIEAEYAGETFFIDASGARDLFTGESLPSDTFYRAISDERGGSDVVASPISTVIEALKDSDPELTPEAILQIIFGANTQVEMDDLNNPDNFILSTDTTRKPTGSPEAIAEQIASTSIQLQVLIEQVIEQEGDLDDVLAAIGESFDISDLDPDFRTEANERIIEARERAGGDPIANPVTGTTATLNNDLALEMDVWGFRDPVGNVNDDSSFMRLDIDSITDGITTDVRGVLVHIADDGIETEYGAGEGIEFEHLGNLFFRPATDYSGRVEITYTVFDGEDDSDEASLEIEVIFDPDAPVFSSTAPTSANENTAFNDNASEQGNAVSIYEARATTSATNGEVTYELAGTDAALFGINGTSGDIWFRTTHNYEAENNREYSFRVVARVIVNGVVLTTEQAVTLTIADVNDAPTLTATATGTITENAPSQADTGVTLTPDDEDGDTFDAVTSFTIYEGASGTADTDISQRFGVVEDNGVFRLVLLDNSTLDSVNASEITLRVVVSDNSGADSNEVTVTITVTDIDPNAPVFTSGGSPPNQDENIAANNSEDTQANAMMVYDAEIETNSLHGTSLSYSLLATDDGNSFGINASTGIVWFRSPPDHEDKPSYSFTVVASVTVNDVELTTEQAVTLNINDLNDSPPVFTSSATASVNENIAANDDGDTQGSAATIYTAIAAPDDAGDTVSYSLTSANDGDSFGINASTGDVWFRASPDHESGKTSYSFTVVASVTVNDVELTTEQAVTLNINDLNDSPPIFADTSDAVSVSVDENIAANDDGDTQGSAATIYTAIAAPDDAGDTVSYSLTSANDGDSFGINASTGDVWFRTSPDYEDEDEREYTFTVVASVTADGVTQTATRIVTLSVTDLNDNAPVFTSSATASVNENIAANDDGDTQGSAATIYTAIAAPDDAGDTVSYSLTSANDGDSFGINASTGTVWLRSPPDHENKSSYSFTVVASVTADGVTHSESQIITLSVTDLNDNAPVFTSSATASVNENIAVNDDGDTQGSAATIYTAIAAPDDAGDTVSYSLTSANDGDSFGINASMGDVWLRSPPDHENKSSYSFTVVASVTADGATHSASQIITLSVTDLNDNAPVFTSSATASVNENIAANDSEDTQGSAATIYTAIAVPDVEGAAVVYSLGGADSASFGIDASMGTVWFRAAPDHENKSSYSFTVTATVGDLSSEEQTVTVNINDLNDSPPIFADTSDAEPITVNEDVAVNDADTQGSAATIYTAIATPDRSSDSVMYSLADDDTTTFGIDSSNGDVWFKTAPVFDANDPTYSFTVTATVTVGTDIQTASQVVTVTITDRPNLTLNDIDVALIDGGVVAPAATVFTIDGLLFTLNAGETSAGLQVKTVNTGEVGQFSVNGGVVTIHQDNTNGYARNFLERKFGEEATNPKYTVTDAVNAVSTGNVSAATFLNGGNGDGTGFFAPVFTIQGIEFRLKAGETATGIQFTSGSSFGVDGDVVTLNSGNINGFRRSAIRDAVNDATNSKYTAKVADGVDEAAQIQRSVFVNGGNSGFYTRPALSEVDADIDANGTLDFSHGTTSLTQLRVRVGNTDNPETPLSHNASTETTVTINGDASNSNGDAYGQFTFTRASDGTVSWAYRLTETAADGLVAGEVATDSVFVRILNDNDVDSPVRQITVTITGTNDAPTITRIGDDASVITGAVTEDPASDNTASGEFFATDAEDDDATLIYSVEAQGLYGTLTLTTSGGADGKWSYVLDNTNETVQDLGEDVILPDTIILRATDSEGGFVTQNVTIMITGANNAPTVSLNTLDGQTTESGFVRGSMLIVNGIQFTVKTGNSGEDPVGIVFSLNTIVNNFGVSPNGDLDRFFLSSGEHSRSVFVNNYNFSPNSRYTAEAIESDNTVINSNELVGTYRNSFIDAVTDINANGALTFDDDVTLATVLQVFVGNTDNPATELSVNSSSDALAGNNGYGSFNFTRTTDGGVSWTYALNETAADGIRFGQTATDNVWVRVQDDDLASTVQRIRVSITGANDAPTTDTENTDNVIAGSVTENTQLTVSGEFVATDADGDDTALRYSIVEQGEYGRLTLTTSGRTDGKWTYELMNDHTALEDLDTDDEVLLDTITLQARDVYGALSVPQNITITINGADNALDLTLGETEDLSVTESGVVYGPLIIHGIEFTVDTGNPAGIRFTVSRFTPNDFVTRDDNYDVYTTAGFNNSRSTIASRFNADSTARYAAKVIEDGPDLSSDQIDGDYSNNFNVPAAADLTANGVLTFGTNVDNAADVQFFVGNTDEASANIATEISLNGSHTLAGNGVFGSITDGSYGSFTLIRTADGTVTWSYALDDDAAGVIGFGQTATDSIWVRVTHNVTDAPLDSTIERITVTVNGRYDAPTLASNVAAVAIDENTNTQTNTGITLTPADLDGDTFRARSFTVYEGDDESDRFDVVGNSNDGYRLVLLANNPLNFETEQTIALRVIVNDRDDKSGADSEAVNLTIDVGAVNEAPTLTFSGTAEIAEKADLQADTGRTFTPDDVDANTTFNADSFTVYEGDDESDRFDVVGNSNDGYRLVLIKVNALDHETEPTINLRVVVSDGTLSASQDVTVTVADENDAPTLTLSDIDVAVGESGEAVEADLDANGVLTFGDADEGDTVVTLKVFVGNTDATIANILTEIEAGTPRTIAGKGVSDAIADGVYGQFTFTRAADGSVTWNYTLNEDAVNALGEGETATDSVWVRVNDGNLDSEIQEIKVLITGANDAPTADTSHSRYSVTATVEEDTPLIITSVPDFDSTVTSGEFIATDVDVNDTLSYRVETQGIYGTLTLTTDGQWTYVLDNSNAVVNNLASGASLTDMITIRVMDGDDVYIEQAVTITITGRSDVLGTSLADGTADDPLGDEAATLSQTVQGGHLDDFLQAGTAGDVLIGGYGDDVMTAGAATDWIVYRFASDASGLRADDGGDTINNFSFNADRLVLVDTDATPLGSLTALIELGKGDSPELTVRVLVNGDNLTGLVFEFMNASKDDGPDGSGDASGTTLTINFSANDPAIVLATLFESGAIDADNQLTDTGLDAFVSSFAGRFEVRPLADVGLSIFDTSIFTSGTVAEADENVAANNSEDTQSSAMTVYEAVAVPDDTNNTVAYELLDTGDGNDFGIDASSGNVWFLQPPNHESGTTRYIFTVRASITDASNVVTQTEDRTVTLSVNDLNDTPPSFTSLNAAPNVHEDVAVNDDDGDRGDAEVIYTAVAMPDVEGDTVVYSLVGTTDDSALFGIDASSGDVWFKADPVYNAANPTYSFTVRASVTADGVPQTTDHVVTFELNAPNTVPTVSLSTSDDLSVTEDGFTAIEKFIINNIEFILDDGATSKGIEFRLSSSLPDTLQQHRDHTLIRADQVIDEITIITFGSGGTTRAQLVERFNVFADTNYTAEVVDGANPRLTIRRENFLNGGDNGFFARPAPMEIGDVDANGVLNIGDDYTPLADLQVYLGNTATPTTALSVGNDSGEILGDSGYGTFTFTRDTDGAVTWVYRLDEAAADELRPDQMRQDSVFVKVQDDNTNEALSTVQEISVTITGSNDAPTIMLGTDDVSDVIESGFNTPIDTPANGALVVSDDTISLENLQVFIGNIDADPDNITSEISVDATSEDIMGDARNSDGDAYGSFVFTRAGDGAVTWAYTLDEDAADELVANQTIEDSVFVKVQEDAENPFSNTVQKITVLINGTNDAPRLLAVSTLTDTVTEDTDGENTASGEFIATDVDGEDTSLRYSVPTGEGMYGTLTLDTTDGTDGKWTYVLGNTDATDARVQAIGADETREDTITIRATDGAGASFDQTVTIMVKGVNDAPTLEVSSATADVVTGRTTLTDTGVTLTPADVEGDTFNAGSFTVYEGTDTTASTRFGVIEDNTGVFRLVLLAGNALVTVGEAITLLVTVNDLPDNSGATSNNATVIITVIAVNPDAPMFSSGGSPPNQDENIAANNSEDTQASAVSIYTAVAASASGGNVTYSLAEADKVTFGISGTSGDVWFRAPPDHDLTPRYIFTVIASVTVGSDVLVSDIVVTLDLNDLNDTKPVFSSLEEFNVDADVTPSSSDSEQGTADAIYKAQAMPDVEGATVAYSLVGTTDDSALFGIDASSGNVWFKAAPDYDASNTTYSFTVRASVTAGGVTQTTDHVVTFELNAPNTAPTVSLGATDDVAVTEGGFETPKFILFGIEFTPRDPAFAARPAGTNPLGIQFFESLSDQPTNVDDIEAFRRQVTVDVYYLQIMVNNRQDVTDNSYTRDEIIAVLPAIGEFSTRDYTAALVEAGTGGVTISRDDLVGGGGPRPERDPDAPETGFYANPLPGEVAADIDANGTLNFNDDYTSAAELKVFIGNTSNNADDIETPLTADGIGMDFEGKGESDDIANGVYGMFTFTRAADGSVSWTYTLNESAVNALGEGEMATDSIFVKVQDNNTKDALNTVQTITVTITGRDDVPTADTENDAYVIAGTVTEDTDSANTAMGEFIATDADDTAATFTYSVPVDGEGMYGTLTLDTAGGTDGKWTYELGNTDATDARVQAIGADETREDTITIRATDGAGLFVERDVTITIEGTNDAPTLNEPALTSTIFYDGLIFTAKDGTTPSGIKFESVSALALLITSDGVDRTDNTDLFEYDERFNLLFSNIKTAFEDSRYTVTYLEGYTDDSTFQRDNYKNVDTTVSPGAGDSLPLFINASDLSVTTGDGAVGADSFANGRLVFNDIDNTVEELKVLVGNQDENIATITNEITVGEETVSLDGNGVFGATTGTYGTFTFSRAANGVVTWEYTLNENAPSDITATETATDSFWVRVNDATNNEAGADSPVRKITVTINGRTNVNATSENDGSANNPLGTNTATVPQTVQGDSGNDFLQGGRSSDILIGGTGNDIIALAPGGDDTIIYRIDSTGDNIVASDGRDTINNFSVDVDANNNGGDDKLVFVDTDDTPLASFADLLDLARGDDAQLTVSLNISGGHSIGMVFTFLGGAGSADDVRLTVNFNTSLGTTATLAGDEYFGSGGIGSGNRLTDAGLTRFAANFSDNFEVLSEDALGLDIL